ncbi:hypothetical protein AB6O49_01030 [Streptomyces sp. SBR177]
MRGLVRLGDELGEGAAVPRQQGVEGRPGILPLAQVRVGEAAQFGRRLGAQQVAFGETGERGEGVAGGTGGADEVERVEETGGRHALGPVGGAVV